MNFNDFKNFYNKNNPYGEHCKYVNKVINNHGYEAGILSCLGPCPKIPEKNALQYILNKYKICINCSLNNGEMFQMNIDAPYSNQHPFFKSYPDYKLFQNSKYFFINFYLNIIYEDDDPIDYDDFYFGLNFKNKNYDYIGYDRETYSDFIEIQQDPSVYKIFYIGSQYDVDQERNIFLFPGYNYMSVLPVNYSVGDYSTSTKLIDNDEIYYFNFNDQDQKIFTKFYLFGDLNNNKLYYGIKTIDNFYNHVIELDPGTDFEAVNLCFSYNPSSWESMTENCNCQVIFDGSKDFPQEVANWLSGINL